MSSSSVLPHVLLAGCVLLATQPAPSSSSSSFSSPSFSSHRHPSYAEHFHAAGAVMQAAKAREGNSLDATDLKTEWPPLFSSALFQQEMWRALDQLGHNVSLMDSLSATPNVSAVCLQHTQEVLAALFEGNFSALSMIDAMGKPSPDLALFNLRWPGALKECLGVTFMNGSSPQQPLFSGEYCTAYITLALKTPAIPMPFQVMTGICVPDSCSSLDVSILLNEALYALHIPLPQYAYAACQDPEGVSVDGLAIAGIAVVAVFVGLMLVGTVVDVAYQQITRWRVEKVDPLTSNMHGDSLQFHGQHDGVLLLGADPSRLCRPGLVAKMLIAFSVYTNGAKLLSTERAAGTLDCVHGIRFLSMTWVVLGHTFLFPLFASSNLIGYISGVIKRWTFQAIINATVSVDTFFVLSGLLVAYLSLRELKKSGDHISWLRFFARFFIHRFWRLTPPYMLIIFVYLSLGPYWGSGPMWTTENSDRDNCKTYWWANMLYINNFLPQKDLCLGQSWYLANDMQFYILSPLIFIPFFISPVYGVVSSLVFLLATTVPPAALTMTDNLQSSLGNFNTNSTNNNYFDDYYVKPYNRMGPYIMGMVTGYLLYRTDCKVQINKVVNLLCWAVATATALAVLYGLYDTYQGHPLTLPVEAVYNSCARTAWGASVAWVIFACATGNGGFVNTILSWKGLVPLSRLTYCIYLLHIMVLSTYIISRDTPFYYSDANLVVLFLALLVACYMVSAVVSLAFEAPMMALEKLLLHRKKDE